MFGIVPDIDGEGPHTYHPNTFGLLYGKTTKTACSKRVPTPTLVKPMDTTCPGCQDVILASMHDDQDMYDTALEIARREGFATIQDWNEAHR